MTCVGFLQLCSVHSIWWTQTVTLSHTVFIVFVVFSMLSFIISVYACLSWFCLCVNLDAFLFTTCSTTPSCTLRQDPGVGGLLEEHFLRYICLDGNSWFLSDRKLSIKHNFILQLASFLNLFFVFPPEKFFRSPNSFLNYVENPSF